MGFLSESLDLSGVFTCVLFRQIYGCEPVVACVFQQKGDFFWPENNRGYPRDEEKYFVEEAKTYIGFRIKEMPELARAKWYYNILFCRDGMHHTGEITL